MRSVLTARLVRRALGLALGLTLGLALGLAPLGGVWPLAGGAAWGHALAPGPSEIFLPMC